MLHILSAPSVHQKFISEVDDAVSTGKVSSPISRAEAEKLVYLQVRCGFMAGWPVIEDKGSRTYLGISMLPTDDWGGFYRLSSSKDSVSCLQQPASK